jgi:hypothetical protein
MFALPVERRSLFDRLEKQNKKFVKSDTMNHTNMMANTNHGVLWMIIDVVEYDLFCYVKMR